MRNERKRSKEGTHGLGTGRAIMMIMNNEQFVVARYPALPECMASCVSTEVVQSKKHIYWRREI